jgi:hypothetical protein
VDGPADRLGPFGERTDSPEYRAGVRDAARDALAAIGDHRRGATDVVDLCRSIVNDPYLREIAPIELLLGFIRAEAAFGLEEEAEEEPREVEEPDEDDVDELDSIRQGCDALAAHLERWQHEQAPG